MVLVYVLVRDNYNGDNLTMQKYEKLPKSYNCQAIFRFIMFFWHLNAVMYSSIMFEWML